MQVTKQSIDEKRRAIKKTIDGFNVPYLKAEIIQTSHVIEGRYMETTWLRIDIRQSQITEPAAQIARDLGLNPKDGEFRAYTNQTFYSIGKVQTPYPLLFSPKAAFVQLERFKSALDNFSLIRPEGERPQEKPKAGIQLLSLLDVTKWQGGIARMFHK